MFDLQNRLTAAPAMGLGRGRKLRLEPLEDRRLLAVVYRVNAGGPQLAGTPVWQTDTATSPSTLSNALEADSKTASTTTAVNMTHPSVPVGTPMALFQTERWDKSTGVNMIWNFPVTAGQYDVRLYFAETVATLQSAGARKFDVSIEGVKVLNDYDIFADVGGYKGVVKTFTVTSDSNLNIEFGRFIQNPTIKGIEILTTTTQPGQLVASPSAVGFGSVEAGNTASQVVNLTNGGPAGSASITIVLSQATLSPASAEFSYLFSTSNNIVLAPGQSTPVTVKYSPANLGNDATTLNVPHSGTNSPLQIALSGTGGSTAPISFGKSQLTGATVNNPTSLQFGPDGKLYVAEQNGLIKVFTVQKTGANAYQVTNTQTINLISTMPNRNDNGALNSSVTGRLVTGLLVAGTAANPIIYVGSADPRIGGGNSGTDLNLDTNSGVISRLTWNGSAWQKLDLVRGLSRSEENHSINGMQFDAATNSLYVAAGGNTNMGAPSNNFALLPEYALSAAILKIDLSAIGNTTYDLPTLDDETRTGTVDANDPFGGNDGKNQAKLVPGGPVQVYAPGFRNPYDVIITSAGRMYSVDNGPNAGWGDVPIGEGPGGNATNQPNEPGQSLNDSLHFITGQGYYGGHPNPTRSNPNNKFNTSNPQSPVSVANAVESDYRAPGAANGALATFPNSTNGITEYTTGNFGSAMQGDLLIASFDNSIKRIKFNAAGTAVVLNQNLFSNVGVKPLDVTAVGATGPFPGTIWVADYGAKILVFEPSSSTGGGNPNDLDADGYTNADETANGTNPENPADVPPDWDADFVSNLNDPNDDNDAFPDTSDKFAIDGTNGQSTPIGTSYTWENDAPDPGGILDLGFTGLMTNGQANYASLFDPTKVTAGGAAGVFTIDAAGPGTAKGAANSQTQGFQIGVNVAGQTQPFSAHTRVLSPFAGLTPQPGQEMGFYIGTGDQSNFVQIAVSGDGGGSINVWSETADAGSQTATQAINVAGLASVDLFLLIDPVATTVQPSYSFGGGARTNLGGPIAVPASWLTSSLATGVISTSPSGSGALSVTWDFLEVLSETTAAPTSAKTLFVINPGGTIDGSSTYKAGSFKITNNSTASQKIQKVRVDLSTAFMRDQVFDPNGTAGDKVAKTFTPDAGAALTGLVGGTFLVPHDGGFDVLEITFTDFGPGEQFTFSVDIDPTSIKGAPQPGPEHSGSMSGLELTGSTITVQYTGGVSQVADTYRVPNSLTGSQVNLAANRPAAPSLQVVGIAGTTANVSNASQTARITGPAGASVSLLQVEGALLTATVPGGGFDLDPFEANKAIKVVEKAATIGANGVVNIPITLTKSHTAGGLNHLMAVIKKTGGITSDLSQVIILKYNPPGGASATQAATQASSTQAQTLSATSTTSQADATRVGLAAPQPDISPRSITQGALWTKALSELSAAGIHLDALPLARIREAVLAADVNWHEIAEDAARLLKSIELGTLPIPEWWLKLAKSDDLLALKP